MTGALSPLGRSLRDVGFRGDLRVEAPLARHTTWRMGGPAELLARPSSPDDVLRALRWADRRGVDWRVLGNGSNLLVREAGVRGLVLHLRKVMDHIRIDGPRLVAGAGALLPVVANRAAAEGLAGLEFAAGIPGTVGGAVLMNAGWHEHETGSVVESVELVDPDGTARTIERDACAFTYRGSAFRGRAGVLIEACLVLGEGEPREVRGRLDRFAASRRANQPTDVPSCGSVFLKPPGDFAGRLIDEAGLKGLRVGDIEVSPLHANFFVNHGEGTASDALALVERVEEVVARRFGVRLVREFELW
jgi:UDP-N-acetylmuramate dehydrogenase